MADQYRLPRTVVPSRYAVTLEPDLEAFTFDGREAIELEVAEPVREIVLNSIELEIDEAWVVDALTARVEPFGEVGAAWLRRLG